MTVTLKRQLNEEEKNQILAKHGRRCWATGLPIGDDEPLHFDHIHAFSRGGVSELDNIAPMCGTCNTQKGSLSLEDFRVKLRLQEFFAGGDTLTLGDLLRYLVAKKDVESFGGDVGITQMDDQVLVRAVGFERAFALHQCPTTGWKYFYATFPVSIIDSDDDRDRHIGLQPRYLIVDKVFDMFRHFQRHPVLQPSVGRLVGNKIRLFDGQHKIAGLLWTGRRDFECKIYIDPDIRVLNQTNIAAHDKYAQTRFFSSIMVMKLGSQFGADFEEYKNVDDGQPKSEAAFLKWLERREGTGVSKGDLSQRFRSYLYNAIVEHPDNKLSRLVSSTNRSTDDKPLTFDLLSKSLFANFLYRHAVEENMATEDYKREDEVNNLVALMTMFDDLAMHAWNPKAGANDGTQAALTRLFRSKSAMAWSEILKDAVVATLELRDQEDRDRPFYRPLSDEQRRRVRAVVERLVRWKWWAAPANDEIDRVLSDNKSEVKAWFRKMGLTTGYLLGAPE